MKRKWIGRFLKWLVVLVVAVTVPTAVVLSWDSACAPAPPAPAGVALMKAIVQRCYGDAGVLALEDVAKPVPAADEVLVRVHAAAANPLDWHYLHGTPYIMRFSAGIGRPNVQRLGVDFAGTVEAVGASVTKFAPGDEVFGGRTGAFAEYVVVRESRNLVHKPANVSFAQSAGVAIAAVTALQALRDHGHVQPGDKVLVNGASGGVGTFAVQIAKALGAEVTGVCSTRNVALVRSLGADRVVDYTQEDFTRGDERYDVIVDMVGNRGMREYRRVLADDGHYVVVGGPDGRWLGPLTTGLKAIAVAPFVQPRMGMMFAELNPADLALLAGMMESGRVVPVVDRTYALAATAEALRYLETGRARGKVVIDLAAPASAE